MPKLMPLIVMVALTQTATVAGGSKLSPRQQQALDGWLSTQIGMRLATVADCGCSDAVARMRNGHGGVWAAEPTYEPYVATGDFNSDGIEDFAVVLVRVAAQRNGFVLVVFNGSRGPVRYANPAFVEQDLDLTHQGLFYGPPRAKPYRLLLGFFGAEGDVLEPKGQTYNWRAYDGTGTRR